MSLLTRYDPHLVLCRKTDDWTVEEFENYDEALKRHFELETTDACDVLIIAKRIRKHSLTNRETKEKKGR